MDCNDDKCGRSVYNTKEDPTLCQPNYRKWCSLYKKKGSTEYAIFDPAIYYHNTTWYGNTPKPEHCNEINEKSSTNAKLYCNYNRLKCTQNKSRYQCFSGGKRKTIKKKKLNRKK